MKPSIQLNHRIISVALILSAVLTSFSLKAQEKGKFTDERDKKSYNWVKIGTQVWMAENLKFVTPKGSYAYNNDQSKVADYGLLYEWSTAKTACPSGWHLPTDEEWVTMLDLNGGKDEASGRLIEKGNAHWTFPGNDAGNESGFTALPGGYKYFNQAYFNYLGRMAFFWTATAHDEIYSYYRCMKADSPAVFRYGGEKPSAYSVRCVKDN